MGANKLPEKVYHTPEDFATLRSSGKTNANASPTKKNLVGGEFALVPNGGGGGIRTHGPFYRITRFRVGAVMTASILLQEFIFTSTLTRHLDVGENR